VADCALTPTSQVHYDGEGTRGVNYDRRTTEDSGVVPDRFRSRLRFPLIFFRLKAGFLHRRRCVCDNVL
jgi:hypothetical protein